MQMYKYNSMFVQKKLYTLIHQIKGGLYLTGLKLKRGLINVLQGKKVFKETLIKFQT